MRVDQSMKTFLTAVAVIMIAAGPALAAPRYHSAHRDWKVYTADTNRGRACYALSDAKDKAPRASTHGRVVMMVSTWRNGAAREQPSFLVGYDLKVGAPTRASVGRSSWRMFVDEREGFLENASDERALVRAMKAGSTMRVKTVSQRGTHTAYEFSLLGVTSALNTVRSLCGR